MLLYKEKRKSIRNIFLLCLCLKRNIRNFWFSDFSNSLLKYKKFCKLVAKKFHFAKNKKILECFLFISWAKKVTSWNIRKFHFLKNFRVFVSWNIRKFVLFFWAIFAKPFSVDVWQCSEYVSGSEYNRVLNMSWFWIYLSGNIRKTFFKKIYKSSLSWKLGELFLRKYKKLFRSRFLYEKIQEIVLVKHFGGWGQKVC